MQRLNFKVMIDAPRKKVWKTMLDSETYQEWTSTFMPGSYYLGNWREGSKIVFLAPDEKGDLSGMVGRIRKNVPNECISIEYTDVVEEEETHSFQELEKEWKGARENYIFNSMDNGTELLIELDTPDEYVEEMKELWPSALHELKKLAEKED